MGKFTGIWPALVTPLTEEGQVNAQVAEELIEALIATGIGGLYVCGSTGEGILLPPDTRRKMAEVAIGAAAGRVPVMVHVGAINTERAVELAQHANLAGADAISAVPSFYFKYPFRAILEHYRAIVSVSQVPLYVYHIPGCTGITLTPEELLEICALPGVAGLKYSSSDLYALSRLLAMRDPDEVNVLSGPDSLFLSCLVLGVEGAVGTTYNFMPRLYVDIMECLQRGDLTMARRLQFAANQIIRILISHSGIPATKALLSMLGYPVGYCIPPMPRIEGEEAKKLRSELEEASLPGLLRRNALHGPPGDPMRGRLA